jgi:hypothetical protein
VPSEGLGYHVEMRFRRGFKGGFVAAAVLAGCFLVTPAQASVPLDTGSSAVAGADIVATPEAIENAWTAEDMRNAVPPDPPESPGSAFDIPSPGASASAGLGEFLPGNVSAYPQRVHGKIFYSVGPQLFVCSGTVISSRGRNVVLTAGHCVYNHNAAAYASQVLFVPGYDGTLDPAGGPFGVWPATTMFTTRTFFEDGNRLSHDIGAVVLADPVEDQVGSRGIAFDLNPAGRSFDVFGYPAGPTPPYDGTTLIGCDVETIDRDSATGSPAPIAVAPCDMGSGSSGGGWVTAGGYVNSVVSYGYCDAQPSLCGITFGPYFTDQAKALYTYPAIGGSVTPTARFLSGPPKRVRARSAKFKVTGTGSTPLGYRCKIDRQRVVNCGTNIRVTRLSRGKHVLKVIARDQTGKQSRAITRTFRVVR